MSDAPLWSKLLVLLLLMCAVVLRHLRFQHQTDRVELTMPVDGLRAGPAHGSVPRAAALHAAARDAVAPQAAAPRGVVLHPVVLHPVVLPAVPTVRLVLPAIS